MDFRTDKLLHGGDYNPEQWLKRPDILEKDIDMLEESGCNVVSLGIFSWSTLEPEEGVFHFGWLQEIIDKLYKRGISTILATPSGARPKWMADKYPEVLRVDETRHRALFGFRHNHCYTSPVYREKVHIINKKLAQEVATHPGVILWHISNEYGGECHCPLCQEAFRNWLKEKYGTIDNLNKTYGTTFWSQTYRSFEELNIPKAGACYDTCHDTQGQNPALLLDYYRFCSDSVVEFTKESVDTIKEYSDLPITSNLLDAAINSGTGIDYFKLSKEHKNNKYIPDFEELKMEFYEDFFVDINKYILDNICEQTLSIDSLGEAWYGANPLNLTLPIKRLPLIGLQGIISNELPKKVNTLINFRGNINKLKNQYVKPVVIQD